MSERPKTIAAIDLGDFSSQQPDRYGHTPLCLRMLGPEPVFMASARRLLDSEWIDEVYIVGSNVPGHVLRMGISGFKTCQLPTAHLVDRLAAAADDSDSDWVLHVPANCPFIDRDLTEQLASLATEDCEFDYLGYASASEDGHRIEHLGLVGEAFHADTLRRLRGHVESVGKVRDARLTDLLNDAPGAYHLKFIPLPKELDRQGLRFCVDNESDWNKVQELSKRLPLPPRSWQELTASFSDDH